MDSLALGYMDIFFFVMVALSTILGLVSGFIATILSFFCWGGAFAATYWGLKYAQPLMEQYIKNPFGAQIAAAVSVFIISFIIIGIINSQLLRVTRHLRMGIFDMSLGAAFGFVRGAAVVVVFVFSVLLVNSMLISGGNDDKHEGIDRSHKQSIKEKTEKQQVKNKEVEPLWLKKSQSYKLARNVILVILENAKDYPQMMKLLAMMQGDSSLMGALDTNGVNSEMMAKKAALLLDPVVQKNIFNKYQTSNETMTEMQHIMLSMDILVAYKKSVQEGLIPKAKQLDGAEIDSAVIKLGHDLKIVELQAKEKEILGK
ncbi:MAG: CvpA family protein [Alphaproteobacteria bacterium]|nr:CvpA family protein [Alphaproteobacteria bacterium]